MPTGNAAVARVPRPQLVRGQPVTDNLDCKTASRLVSEGQDRALALDDIDPTARKPSDDDPG